MAAKDKKEQRLQGTPICVGVAIGKPFVFTFSDDLVPEFSISSNEVKREITRYQKALDASRQDIIRLKDQLENEGPLEGILIMEAHLQMMQDPLITTRIEEEIRTTRKNAEYIFQIAIDEYEEKFNKIPNKFFRDRFKDIQDISRRIMQHLRKSVRITLADIPPNSIVFTHELSPSDTAEALSSSIKAFVVQEGGETSHAAIMAKAKGIPYVVNVNFGTTLGQAELKSVIVDGRTGEVIIHPTQRTLAKYRDLQKQLDIHLTNLESNGTLESETIDGYKVLLSANIEMFEEFDMLHKYGGEGVGLFRSEYLFSFNDDFPNEEEQYVLYRQIVEKMKGLPVVIRTFDIGGDKFRSFQQSFTHVEDNPFLGCRAIRFMLKQQEAFKNQLRAILRAGALGEVSIMFPMVSGLPELLEAKQLLKETCMELKSEGIETAEHIRIGCMIEVPSAAITCDILAKECDFLSIGTNDLVQYSLAVDRGNHAMSYLYSPTHPSVIRLIKMIVAEGNRNGIPVSICGEIGADPRFTSLLLGLGVHELSVASRYIPIVKNAIRNTSIVEATELAEKALGMPTAAEIKNMLVEEYRKNVAHDFLYNH
ncbi:phosphoenolpyruvate--protein phosphotransferase [Simkania negevensis]|uniref:Phosphoenolpyruvate-protein phosphotransferase n=1 Tax=Simkania negevensis TaxID=83561 RepID=A0ABS3AQM0_9BACT|nr:phosphoenolpyruvate--protein phosphotransferase [Simkania negevensis]